MMANYFVEFLIQTAKIAQINKNQGYLIHFYKNVHET